MPPLAQCSSRPSAPRSSQSPSHPRMRPLVRGLAIEVSALLSLFGLYEFGRLLADGRHALAREHAEQVWHLEHLLHLPPETWLQARLLEHPWMAQLANGYYASVHFPLTAAVLLCLYLRRRQVYRRTRNTLVLATAVSLLVAFAYPLAPPRMMTALGFTDVAAVFGQSVYEGAAQSTSNQFAAMPSLHVGWAVLLACALTRACRSRRRLRLLWWAHPAVTVLVVAGTGNHFWLDGVVGTLLVLLAWAFVAQLCPVVAGAPLVAAPVVPVARTGRERQGGVDVGAAGQDVPPTAVAVAPMTATGRRDHGLRCGC